MHKWTEEERLIVRRDYMGTFASAEAIARRLSRPDNPITTCAVFGQAWRLGIANFQVRQHWSPNQEEQLLFLLGRYAPATVAKKVHRPEGSIRNKARQLGYSLLNKDGWYNEQEVAEILGHDHNWVRKRIDTGAIKAKSHSPTAEPKFRGGQACWHITRRSLKTFIVRHTHELLGRNVDLISIVDLFTGGNHQNTNA